jgi:hypothetical protein
MDIEQLPSIIITLLLIGFLSAIGILIFTTFETGTSATLAGAQSNVSFTGGTGLINNNYCLSASLTPHTVSYQWCYQESANVSNQGGLDGPCALTYTGKYNLQGDYQSMPGGSPNVWNDGNYSTYLYGNVNESDLYVNYTIPTNANSNSFWQFTDGVGTKKNASISPCFGASSTNLQLWLNLTNITLSHKTAHCYNGTQYVNISGYLSGNALYEEAMWWNITVY